MQDRIIDLLECDMKIIPTLKQDIALIKNDMTYMKQDMSQIKEILKEINNKPKENWNLIVTVVISSIVSLSIGFLASRIFGGI